jgi:hypothetical protein
MANGEQALRSWDGFDTEEQTDLCVAFGHYLDSLPPTCSLETKVESFRSWQKDHGVDHQDAPWRSCFAGRRGTCTRSPR